MLFKKFVHQEEFSPLPQADFQWASVTVITKGMNSNDFIVDGIAAKVYDVEEIKHKGDIDMQKKYGFQLTSWILCMILITAMALVTTGCNGSKGKDTQNTFETWKDGSVIGDGSKEFLFTVVDEEGSEAKLEIHTDEETVGAALSGLGLIDGDESEFGLYVKTVNGITLDYDKDGKYWAFYINGEYAQTGVDAVEITEGDSYSFKIEKA